MTRRSEINMLNPYYYSGQGPSSIHTPTPDLARGQGCLGPERTESTKRSLLGFLAARPKPVGDAFRTNPRRRSSIRARLSWTARGETREVPARLINVSRAGAA